ncbi:hypothetical protein COV82_02550 [Candidatus Peregrinibacteria bacterium CG11_big_fil_rev_8_21_14_0_20_46_8]|nr:MAG: hypothetical protein COV82_02550 [Candidatus Peregrinibacteria bacterium CG11_big_fil_rev_8_21_14_0_20_46_8]
MIHIQPDTLSKLGVLLAALLIGVFGGENESGENSITLKPPCRAAAIFIDYENGAIVVRCQSDDENTGVSIAYRHLDLREKDRGHAAHPRLEIFKK